MLVLVLIIFVFTVILFGGRGGESKTWNSGTCRECGTKWKQFDIDSQGGRGYKCGCGKHTCWISYSVDN